MKNKNNSGLTEPTAQSSRPRIEMSIKGYIGEIEDQIYYTDGKEVFRANRHNAVDCTTGYLIGRWECSLTHWQRYRNAVYSMVKDCREFQADEAITKFGETSDQCVCGAKEHEHAIPAMRWPKFGQDWR